MVSVKLDKRQALRRSRANTNRNGILLLLFIVTVALFYYVTASQSSVGSIVAEPSQEVPRSLRSGSTKLPTTPEQPMPEEEDEEETKAQKEQQDDDPIVSNESNPDNHVEEEQANPDNEPDSEHNELLEEAASTFDPNGGEVDSADSNQAGHTHHDTTLDPDEVSDSKLTVPEEAHEDSPVEEDVDHAKSDEHLVATPDSGDEVEHEEPDERLLATPDPGDAVDGSDPNVAEERVLGTPDPGVDAKATGDMNAEPSLDKAATNLMSGETSACPSIMHERKGLYNSTKSAKGFENIVLLTMANLEFDRLLSNWEAHSSRLGFQWVLLALDEELYKQKGGISNSILAPKELRQPTNVSHEFHTGYADYRKLCCNKLKFVVDLLDKCNVDIVFSDADNVFLKDPFDYDLGKMILSGKHDYIYQVNERQAVAANMHSCKKGEAVKEGNSGFHYLRSSTKTIELLRETYRRCSAPVSKFEFPKDDQTTLWELLHESVANNTWEHCSGNVTDLSLDQSKGSFCCMDPFHYPTGQSTNKGHAMPYNPNAVASFHANYCMDNACKEMKLREYTVGGWFEPGGGEQVLKNDTSRANTEDSTSEVACQRPTPKLDCLHLTNENLALTYPNDAWEHFQEVHNAVIKWTKDSTPHKWGHYEGPWIENFWLEWGKNETSKLEQSTDAPCLSSVFGPYIPLFVPWVDLFVVNGWRYPKGFADALTAVLRPDVPYITLSQNADGITHGNDFVLQNLTNLLVFSSGGNGHIPIPLFKQPEQVWKEHNVTDRTYLINYVGSLSHDPWELRKDMNRVVGIAAEGNYTYQYTEKWREVMQDSWISLAPRGYGRTAYHVMEALQMGLIPVHVYKETKWIPYGDKFEKDFGFAVTVEELPDLVKRLKSWSKDDFWERENLIVASRDTHFTFLGCLEHVKAYIQGRPNDLQCQKLPSTTHMS